MTYLGLEDYIIVIPLAWANFTLNIQKSRLSKVKYVVSSLERDNEEYKLYVLSLFIFSRPLHRLHGFYITSLSGSKLNECQNEGHFAGILLSLVGVQYVSKGPLSWAKQTGVTSFDLPYYDSNTGNYGRGWKDIYFITATTILLTTMWSVSVKYVFEPIGRRMGLGKHKAKRFGEQTWLGMYCLSMWTLGMVS